MTEPFTDFDAAVAAFHARGHVTLSPLFSEAEIDAAVEDIDLWSDEVIRNLSDADRAWYLEQGGSSTQLRKLDQPVFHRPAFRALAHKPELLRYARELTGADSLDVCFSQVFMKPPEVGGPKPVHQDNFYFGPDRPEAMLTAWIALDEATLENGCLYYGEGSHRDAVIEHHAPEGEPFNLQIRESDITTIRFGAAPVPRGGVSLHHGNTLHRSSANTSPKARRAVAIHYLDREARLTKPALEYDASFFVAIDD